MTEERRVKILEVAAELEAQGLAATNSAVYARALGHRGHVVAVMKARRAERAAAGGVAVVEDPEDEEPEAETETPAVVLAEDLRQLEAAYESWHLALEQIWALEKDGPLDLHTFSRARWLEYQLTENLKQQERVRPALETARLRDAALRGRDRHDAALPAVRTTARATLETIVTLQGYLRGLAHRVWRPD